MEVQKWIRKDGSKITIKEYKKIYSRFKRGSGNNFKDYMQHLGIIERKSKGVLQDPVNNNARLVHWYMEKDTENNTIIGYAGNKLFLTLWGYNRYMKEYSKEGDNISTYLNKKGFKNLVELKNTAGYRATRWINIKNREILFRDEYLKIYNESKKEGLTLVEFMNKKGYYNILKPKGN